MSPERHSVQVGRLILSLPVHAELRELSATLNGVDLEELDLGDDSAQAGYLGWMQVSELVREADDFKDVEVDERCWLALYGAPDPGLMCLQQQQDHALVLTASSVEQDDAVARVHDLRKRYTLSPTDAAACFALGRGLLELPPTGPEELAATWASRAHWSLSVGVCAVSVPSPSNYQSLASALRASSDPALRPHVAFAERARGSLAGEELFMEILGEDLPTYQATWRDPGRANDPGHPEIEVEFMVRGLGLEAAQDEWRRIIESLHLAAEGGGA